MKHFLTFDIGTTAMKCILFDEAFNELHQCNREYDLITYDDGRVELEPETYFSTFCECIKEVSKLGLPITSLTFTTQGETLIPVDKEGKALHNAIVWIDARAEQEAKAISEKFELESFYKKTGLPEINGALPIAKLKYFAEKMPEITKKTYKFLLLEDYFIFRLTSKAVTEKSLVSSTGWYDIVNDVYFEEILDFCSIKEEKLPEVMPCGAVVGNITEAAAKLCGLSEETLVTTGAMDQISSAIGAGNIKNGVVTETTGTALVMAATVDNPEFNINQPITIYKHYNQSFVYMPFCNTAGIVLKWFKDTVCAPLKNEAKEKGISLYALIDKMAEESPAGSGGVILLPNFSGKSVPEAIANASGVFYGITLDTSLSDLSRSVLEGVAYMLRELLEALEKTGTEICEIRSMGGGSASDIWHRIKTDVCNKPIVRLSYAQTTSLGAAILGSVAVGSYKSVEEALSKVSIEGTRLVPNEQNLEVYNNMFAKYKALYNALKDVF